MPPLTLQFGYWPRDLEFQAGPVRVLPLPGLAETVRAVEASEGIENDWIYAPPQTVWEMSGGQTRRPYPSRIFGLPKTHIIEHAGPDSREHVDFHIWMLSFLQGMRLTTTEAGFVDATPLKPGKMVDFLPLNRLERAVEIAEAFWLANRTAPKRARLLVAAVHALFMGENPRHLQFENFIYLYTAMDACCALAASMRGLKKLPLHSDRIAWMCRLFGMSTPPWAASSAPATAEIAVIRNATIHEALFMDAPLGFALHGVGTSQNLTLEMKALLCRFIAALFGSERSEYIRTPINTRMHFELDLSPAIPTATEVLPQ